MVEVKAEECFRASLDIARAQDAKACAALRPSMTEGAINASIVKRRPQGEAEPLHGDEPVTWLNL